MRWLIKTVKGGWEEVTEHIFNNRKFATNDEGTASRYTATYIAVDGNNLAFNGHVTMNELAVICRFLGINSIPPGTLANPLTTPESVRIHKGNSQVRHWLKDGQNWSLQTRKKKRKRQRKPYRSADGE